LFYFSRVHVLFDFCSKAEAQQRMAGQVVPICAEAPPLVSTAPAEKRKCDAKASRKTGAWWAPCSTSARGRKRKFSKVVANSTLLDVEAGASDELPLVITQSFKDGQYSPLIGMEEVE
jgi:hypothetical protein